mmetsp:Transcript_33923/g.74420  ORF Transcript_33923/g.74420 Transcript_33923/m.74420 type:complete len:169 (+) Transcript_33923:146-652(+)
MKSSIAVLARRAAVVASRRAASPAVASTFLRAMSSQAASKEFSTNMDIIEEVNHADKPASQYAVESPDGDYDGHLAEELAEVSKLIDAQAASAEDASAILADRAAAAKITAVESPDGEVDGHLLEEMEEVNHIIDDAAKLEDKEAVEKRHNWEKKERIEAEKHPEHDW